MLASTFVVVGKKAVERIDARTTEQPSVQHQRLLQVSLNRHAVARRLPQHLAHRHRVVGPIGVACTARIAPLAQQQNDAEEKVASPVLPEVIVTADRIQRVADRRDVANAEYAIRNRRQWVIPVRATVLRKRVEGTRRARAHDGSPR